jgi:Phage holin.
MFDIALIIAVVVALVELVKRMNIVPTKFLPLLSLAFGLLAGLIYLGGSFKEKLFYGIVIGLSAAGLFDQSKIITKGDDE